MTGHRLPPLNALRAFEATARHLSMKHAADELCVTPGAVSQLVKGLEQHLGVPLLHRLNRGIALTEAGQSYLPAIRNAFQQIGEATRRIAAVTDSGVLTVSVPPFFASAWLVPRLAQFHARHPEIDLQVLASKQLVDFSRDRVDVAIRHGLGNYPGLRSERIVAVELVPVAAPALAARFGGPAAPENLVAWPLVHDAERKDWYLWFQAQGIADIGAPRGAAFDDLGLLLRAVLAGQGAGLLPAAMVADDVSAGRLVKLTETAWPDAYGYYLAYPAKHATRPRIAAFRSWLLEAAAH